MGEGFWSEAGDRKRQDGKTGPRAILLRYADSVLLTTVDGNEEAMPGTDFCP